MESKECQVCGNEFEKKPTESYKRFEERKYCSRQCFYDSKGMEQHGKSAGTQGECPNCGECFERLRNKQKYCSVNCANKHQYETGERDAEKQIKAIEKSSETTQKEIIDNWKKLR